MKLLAAAVLLGATVPLVQAQIRQDKPGEPIDHRDENWLHHWDEYKPKLHPSESPTPYSVFCRSLTKALTVTHGATFYSGRNCTGDEAPPGSPLSDFKCDINCHPVPPSRSMLLEGLWWKDRSAPLKAFKMYHVAHDKVNVDWKKHYDWIALKGPTAVLYTTGGCEEGSKLGRAYIPDETAFRCINFPQPVRSAKLQHIGWCAKGFGPSSGKPLALNMKDATLADMQEAYPQVDWSYFQGKQREHAAKEKLKLKVADHLVGRRAVMVDGTSDDHDRDSGTNDDDDGDSEDYRFGVDFQRYLDALLSQPLQRDMKDAAAEKHGLNKAEEHTEA
ncbi:hypothetical protein HJFPF1_01614 [Paramyrothecium foliicola]|nr:hypothetical protein HJFPF1_01614 [Paramyrothecium foliicola]